MDSKQIFGVIVGIISLYDPSVKGEEITGAFTGGFQDKLGAAKAAATPSCDSSWNLDTVAENGWVEIKSHKIFKVAEVNLKEEITTIGIYNGTRFFILEEHRKGETFSVGNYEFCVEEFNSLPVWGKSLIEGAVDFRYQEVITGEKDYGSYSPIDGKLIMKESEPSKDLQMVGETPSANVCQVQVKKCGEDTFQTIWPLV